MRKFTRIMLNVLYSGIFLSTLLIITTFSTGSRLADLYDRFETQETVIRNPNPSDCEIVGKTDDGEFLQFILWDSFKQKEHKIRVNPSDYDLYKIGDIYYSNTDTQPSY